MSSSPVPVVVCPGLTGPRTEAAMRALEMGAVDIITKPKIAIRGFLEESAIMLEDTVRAAATAPCHHYGSLLDGTRAYLHAVIDNFSRRILASRVAETFAPVNSVAVLLDAGGAATPRRRPGRIGGCRG